jgi:hypothetical protein
MTYLSITKPWGDPNKAKVLVIGHDPRLQASNTLAGYCLFADYYEKYHSRALPTTRTELSKYQLAKSVFDCIGDLTADKVNYKELLITNLCNKALGHAPPNKTVLIPEDKAMEGLTEIRNLLKNSQVKLIFPMSQQVNYWLQKLGFYSGDSIFLAKSEPKENGKKNTQPYYQPQETNVFKLICGNEYISDIQYKTYPILHTKNYPLKGKFTVYEENYARCKSAVAKAIALIKWS